MAEEEAEPAKPKIFREDKWYGKRMGPLPVGAWIGLVGAALLYARFFRKSIPTATATPADSQTTVDTSAMPGIGNYPYGAGGGGTSTGGAAAITDNQAWIRAATSALVGMGYGANIVDVALRKYVAGNVALTPEDKAIVEAAIQKIGPTPYPVPLAPDTPTVTPPGNGGGADPNRGVLTTPWPRVRARLNALRAWNVFIKAPVDDWPQLGSGDTQDSAAAKQAIQAFASRQNEANAKANLPLLQTSGSWDQYLDFDSNRTAQFFGLSY
jgi:hypothetical protein